MGKERHADQVQLMRDRRRGARGRLDDEEGEAEFWKRPSHLALLLFNR